MNKQNSLRRFASTSRRAKAIIGATLATLVVVSGISLSLGSATAAPTPKATLNLDSFGLLSGEVATVDVDGQQSGIGSFSEGNTDRYLEGSCMPFVIAARHDGDTNADVIINLDYDYSNDGVVGIEDLELLAPNFDPTNTANAVNLSDFTFSPGSSLADSTYAYDTGSVNSTVTAPAPTTSGKREIHHYTVSLEDVPAGTTVNVYACARFGINASRYSNGSNMSVGLSAGGSQNIPISPSNLIERATLTIQKIVDGGEALPENFLFTVSPAIDGETEFSIPADDDSVTIDNIVTDGIYTITEVGLDGYSFASGEGTSCVFGEGGTATATIAHETAEGVDPVDATCIFTNTALDVPTITIVKEVDNGDGGTMTAADFDDYITVNDTTLTTHELEFDDEAETASVSFEVDAGEATVISENTAEGYSLTGISCTNDVSGETSVDIILDYAENVTCTITNDDVAAEPVTESLTVTKILAGETSPHTIDNFALDGFNAEAASGLSFTSGVAEDAELGTWSITEDGPTANYTAEFGGDCDEFGNVTLILDDGKGGVDEPAYNCTITNTYTAPEEPQPSTLTIVKEVDGGDAVATDFSFRATQDTTIISFLAPGTQDITSGIWNITEEGPENYTPSFSDECEEGQVEFSSDTDEHIICTITNTYIEPEDPTASLTVTKEVRNSDIDPSEFSFTVDNGGSLEFDFAHGETQELILDFWHVTESDGPEGEYTTTYDGDCNDEGFVELAEEDGVYECVVINTYPLPEPDPTLLTIIKLVVGAEIPASAFDLFANDAAFENGVAQEVSVGEYTITESSEEYDLGMFDVTYVGDCDGDNVVSVVAEQSHTCTIVNTYIQPDATQITVVVNVINDNGGSAGPSDAGIEVFVNSSSVVAFAGSNSGVTTDVDPGTFEITASDLNEYNRGMSPQCDGDIAEGEHVTCVVTYNDNAGGGGGGGGGGTPPPPTPDPQPTPDPTPEPEVLGETDEQPVPEETPEPEVLGETDELPRTGSPAALVGLGALAVMAAAGLRRRK